MKIEQDPASRAAATPATRPVTEPATTPATTPAAGRPEREPAATAPDASAALRPDSVERSAEAALLQEAMDAVAELPVVDAGRVAAMRAAIASGEYRIDADRIAERMLAAARDR